MNPYFLDHQLESKPMTHEKLDDIGFMLEEKGMSHSQIDTYFLQHHGVKGMKWGVRRNNALTTHQRRLRNINRVHRGAKIAAGALFLTALMSSGGNKRSIPAGSLNKINKVVDKSGHITDKTHTISESARSVLMAQERQRNGAFQVSKLLKSIGGDVV